MGLALLSFAIAAQVPPPSQSPATTEQLPQKSGEAATPARPVLENTGKPMVVEYHCTDEDIQNAGMSCSADDPCPVYLELAAVEAVGNRIFLAGNIHSSSTTLYSVLLASDDSGKSWREPYERIRSAGLDHIQFVDFENGWISGGILSPLPRDPFMLVTTDAGKSWRNRPIFSETRFGAIQQFWFSSRTNGALLVDRGESGDSGRYELYETPDSGETWMLRAVNERLVPIRQARDRGNTDWRIRADGAIKAFRVEHHAGERWHSIAAFAVSIGQCRVPASPAPVVEVAAPAGGSGADLRKPSLPER